MKNSEIINALKKIPQLSNEYLKYKASLANTDFKAKREDQIHIYFKFC